MVVPHATSPRAHQIAKLDRGSADCSVFCFRTFETSSLDAKSGRAEWTLGPWGSVMPRAFPLTWFRGDQNNNVGNLNIRGAWERDILGTDVPVAIKPTYVHPRMAAQKSCFSIHGKNKKPIPELVPDTIVSKFRIRTRAIRALRRNMELLGITHTSVYPEAEYLAKEIIELALYNPVQDP
jgi:hypothetical protein